MKIGIVINSNNSEAVLDAFKFGNSALREGNKVTVFLPENGKGCESTDTDKYKIAEQIQFLIDGGEIFVYGSCSKKHQSEDSELCPLLVIKDLYKIAEENDKIVTF